MAAYNINKGVDARVEFHGLRAHTFTFLPADCWVSSCYSLRCTLPAFPPESASSSAALRALHSSGVSSVLTLATGNTG